MARVCLLSAAPDDPERDPKARLDLEQMRASAALDRFGSHEVVGNAAAADLVLFVETSAGAGAYFELVRRHPVYRRMRDRCFIFCSTDRVVPLLPGVYASVERRWAWPSWTRSGHYLGVQEGGALVYSPADQPIRLFSFVGSSTASPVRRHVVRLADPAGLILDTSLAGAQGFAATGGDGARAYASSIADSAFVLCPRGGGPSSFRLFETMMLGRAPVIISDAWSPPEGPDWDEFSIRVREDEVESIPALLAKRADGAAAMGELARQVWLDWFSPQASFHRTVEWCLELDRRASSRSGVRRYAPLLQLLRPYHAARWARAKLASR